MIPLDEIPTTPLDQISSDDVAHILTRLRELEEAKESPVSVARFGSSV